MEGRARILGEIDDPALLELVTIPQEPLVRHDPMAKIRFHLGELTMIDGNEVIPGGRPNR